MDNEGLIQLRRDPCSFGSTAWLVGYSAVSLAAGATSVFGFGVAIVGVGVAVYDYANECG